MRIFVAGATGVIGRRVVVQLRAAGHARDWYRTDAGEGRAVTARSARDRSASRCSTPTRCATRSSVTTQS